MVIFLPYRYTLSNCSVPSLFIPDATIIPLIWDDIIVLAILSTVLHWQEILTLGIIGMSGSCLGSVPVLASEYWTKVSKQFSSSTAGLWMCAAICPLLFGRISKALLSAVACAIAVIALRLFSEQVRISDNRGYYAEKERYGDVNFEEAGIAIVKFDAPILFINCEHLVEQLRKTAANIKGSPLRCGATRGRITRSDALTTLTDSPKQLTIVSGVDNTVYLNLSYLWAQKPATASAFRNSVMT
ncbi:unnamed protein product [Toxocara canis]|uniref:MFS domain-containing protein n=1 Tax=Toxocara canis TaxID=6265 RepID=A0A183TWY7_TOXCA|nr:unnamed protein product [Toxocara canis]